MGSRGHDTLSWLGVTPTNACACITKAGTCRTHQTYASLAGFSRHEHAVGFSSSFRGQYSSPPRAPHTRG